MSNTPTDEIAACPGCLDCQPASLLAGSIMDETPRCGRRDEIAALRRELEFDLDELNKMEHDLEILGTMDPGTYTRGDRRAISAIRREITNRLRELGEKV